MFATCVASLRRGVAGVAVSCLTPDMAPLARACLSSAARTGCSSRGSASARAREVVVPYVARARGVAPLSLAVAAGRTGSTHGYDVVDPTRISERARRRGRVPRALRRGARRGSRRASSTSSRTTWRPPTRRTRSGATSTLRAQVFDWDPRDRLVPPLLRRRRARRRARRGSRASSRDAREGARARRTTASSTGFASTIRTGSRIRASTSSGCASAARRASGSRRSSSRASACATGPSRGRPATSSRTTSTALFVDPAGEEPLTELYAELTGERRPFAEIAHEAKLEVARTMFAQEFERLRALYPHDALEEAAASLHVYRTYVEPADGPRRGGRPPRLGAVARRSAPRRAPRRRALAAARRVRRFAGSRRPAP